MNEVNKTLFIPLYGKSIVSKQHIILDDPEERAREQASVTGKEVPVQSVCDRLDFDTQPAEDRGAGSGRRSRHR